jgi:hypothetical protein
MRIAYFVNGAPREIRTPDLLIRGRSYGYKQLHLRCLTCMRPACTDIARVELGAMYWQQFLAWSNSI